VPDALTVDLNGDGPQSIRAPQAFETTGEFDVFLQNHGPPLHVHVRLGPTLSKVATVRTPNRYVEEGSTRRVRIKVEAGKRPTEGRLEVITGYGSNREFVSVAIRDPETVDPSVRVDEELGQPRTPPDQPAIDPQRLLVLSVGAVAGLLALVAAFLTQDPLVSLGVLVVLVAVVAASYLLV